MPVTVGNGDVDVGDAELQDGLFDSAADGHDGLSARLVANLDVAPGDALAPAGAQGLEDRLLGGPTAGEMLSRLLPIAGNT